jgi:hypothetical protein
MNPPMDVLPHAFQNPFRDRRFFQQHIKGRDVGVPFDQCWSRPETLQCFVIKPPHIWTDGRAMIVNADDPSVRQLLDAMSREMDLANRAGGQCV